ncbi:MAG: tRNA lysidine(34) synthetase TilS [Planctomycetota bacterium]
MRFVDRVREFSEEHRLFDAGDTVCAGFSGGPDSTALVLVLQEFLKEGRIAALMLAHLDHSFRKDSAADVKFCAAFARRRRLEFVSDRIDVKAYAGEHNLSMETAAREVRHGFFTRVAEEKGAGKIAIGHQSDDQAETVLFRILRGTGIRGLAGIRPIRPVRHHEPDGIQFVRPLLCVSREEIEAFIRRRRVKTLSDPSNLDPKFTRNHIRNEVLPYLRKRWPKVTESLADLAGTAETVRREIDGAAAQMWSGIVVESSGARVKLDRAGLLEADAQMIRELFLRAMHVLGVGERDYSSHHYRRLESAARTGIVKEQDFPGRMKLEVTEKEITLSRAVPRKETSRKAEPVPLPVPGSVIFGDDQVTITARPAETGSLTRLEAICAISPWDECIPADIADNLVVRSRKEGDRFHPLGAAGSKKLAEFFTDLKVPASVRDSVPLVTRGETILWVVGYRLSEKARITPGAAGVVRLHAQPGAWA